MTVLGLLHAPNASDELKGQTEVPPRIWRPLEKLSHRAPPPSHASLVLLLEPKLLIVIKAFRAQDNIHQPVYLQFSVFILHL